jgi:acyl-coenzyme A synthetase/AMP-(fatty) acid ligase
MAVPLHPGHAPKEMEYIINDARPLVVVGQPAYTSVLSPLATKYGATYIEIQPYSVTPLSSVARVSESDERFDDAHRAMLVYTSGTTGQPSECLALLTSVTLMLISCSFCLS